MEKNPNRIQNRHPHKTQRWEEGRLSKIVGNHGCSMRMNFQITLAKKSPKSKKH